MIHFEDDLPDEMNIPVGCSIDKREDGKWVFSASNYMPGKERVEEGEWEVIADSREEIVFWVRRYVIPLYVAALSNLYAKGENCYWENKGGKVKLKNIKGLLPEYEFIEAGNEVYEEGRKTEKNRNIDEIGEKDLNDYIELDVDKIICFLNSLQEYRPERQNRFSEKGTQYLCLVSKTELAQAIAKADIIKVKEGK